MTVREYPVQTSERSGTLTFADAPDHVRLTLKFDKYGILGDEVELEGELKRVFAECGRDADQFGREPRLIVLTAPDVGGRSLILDGVEQ